MGVVDCAVDPEELGFRQVIGAEWAMTKIELWRFAGSPLPDSADLLHADRLRDTGALRFQYAHDKRWALTKAVPVIDGAMVFLAGVASCWALPDAKASFSPHELVWMLSFSALLMMWCVGEPRLFFVSPDASPFVRGLLANLQRVSIVFAGIGLISFLICGTATAGLELISLWFGLSLITVSIERDCVRRVVSTMLAQGKLDERVAIVGAGEGADRLVERYECSDRGATQLLGVFDDRKTRSETLRNRPKGTIEDLLRLGREIAIDRILIALPLSAEARTRQLIQQLKSVASDIQLGAASLSAYGYADPPTEPAPLTVVLRPIARWDALVKRAEDLVVGSLLLLVAAPFMLLIALAIRVDSPGPILFRQRRHGQNNCEIEVLKFRSMRSDLSDSSGSLQATLSDTRVTRVGRFIRRFSLDELPQLINVVRGDMSLVGPRPLPTGMRTAGKLCGEIHNEYAHRHRVKPGITGWAQVNGLRGPTSTPEQLKARIAHDLEYIDRWSIGFDLRILIMTVLKVISAENAF
jgi:Undecaprenyl-phosphate glucose phosphotransferase